MLWSEMAAVTLWENQPSLILPEGLKGDVLNGIKNSERMGQMVTNKPCEIVTTAETQGHSQTLEKLEIKKTI